MRWCSRIELEDGRAGVAAEPGGAQRGDEPEGALAPQAHVSGKDKHDAPIRHAEKKENQQVGGLPAEDVE